MSAEESEPQRGSPPGPLLQISREVSRIYKEQFGRGPKNAYTHFAGPDTVVCILQGTLAPVERRLAQIGEEQRLQDMRQLFQSHTSQAFKGTVESALGRKVVGFMSGNDIDEDFACEVFVLAPADTPPASG